MTVYEPKHARTKHFPKHLSHFTNIPEYFAKAGYLQDDLWTYKNDRGDCIRFEGENIFINDALVSKELFLALYTAFEYGY